MPRLHRHGFFILIIILGACFQINAQADFTISGNYTIPAGTTEEYNNLILDNNNSNLVVNGTLIVHGNLLMTGNKSMFSMGASAFVLVNGNFEGSNQVNISVSSYLIIQGNFSRRSGSNQGELAISEGNIYIFGDVDGWPVDFTTCDDYDGTTDDRETEDCDFGTEDDYEDNIDDFPEEYIDKLNCFNIQNPEDQSACVGGSATFSVNVVSEVNYQWQYKLPDTEEYIDIGTDSNILQLNNITSEMDGYIYRVVVRASTDDSGCKVTVSKPGTLLLQPTNEWTGNIDTDWNTAGNWLCNTVPNLTSDIVIPSGLTNYPVLNTGATGKVHDLLIESGASLQIIDNYLEINGNVASNEKINAIAGGLKFVGNIQQTIPEGLLLNDRIENLEIDNSGNVLSDATIELTGILKITQGDFDAGDDLTLISNATQTALIDGTGSGEVIGNIKMQRYISPAIGYKYFSSPFINSKVGDFSSFVDLTSSFPNFYRYDENRKDSQNRDATGWEAYTASNASLNTMEGYAINFGTAGAAVNVELTGTVNNGNYSVNLINHNGTYTKGFHLMGNPYPSPIDWNSGNGWTRNNIDDAIYFFRANDEYTGTYSSYVNGISSSDGKSSNIIPSMQGFFVHVSDPANGIYPSSGSFGMTNEVRVNDFSQEFIKTSSSEAGLIRLAASFKDIYEKDGMVLYFDPASSENFEKDKDALKLLNTNMNVPNIYLLADERKLSINAIPYSENKERKLYPLGLKTERAGIIQIHLQEIKNLSENLKVYLIDKQKNKFVNLREGAYQFQSEIAEYDSRFFLSFSPVVINEPGNVFSEPFSAIDRNHSIDIRMNLEHHEKGILQVNTINGQLIEVVDVQSGEDIKIEGIKSSGVYLVSFISDKRKFTKKVVIRR